MLNNYRDEAGEFLKAIGAEQEDAGRIFDMLEQELSELKQSLYNPTKRCHQIYDMLFLLFELAARNGDDLDAEWKKGRESKIRKYPQP